MVRTIDQWYDIMVGSEQSNLAQNSATRACPSLDLPQHPTTTTTVAVVLLVGIRMSMLDNLFGIRLLVNPCWYFMGKEGWFSRLFKHGL